MTVRERIFGVLWLFVNEFLACCDCSWMNFCSRTVNVRENVQNVREMIYIVVFLVWCSKMVLKRAVIVKCSKCFQDSKCFWCSKCFKNVFRVFLNCQMFKMLGKCSNFLQFGKCQTFQNVFQNAFNSDPQLNARGDIVEVVVVAPHPGERISVVF